MDAADAAKLQLRIDELNEAYSALLREHEKIKYLAASPEIELKLAIFDRIPMPVWACDRNCKIVFWNEGAARLYGHTVEEAIGKDFVDLFVNEPERAKARADCMEIIDNNKPWKNMADDVDKNGNTRKLVTHCFPMYGISGHEALQVEISYEAQDYDRLKKDLEKLQSNFRREQEKIEELKQSKIQRARDRADSALKDEFASAKERIRQWESDTRIAELAQGSDRKLILTAKKDILAAREKLTNWERQLRERLALDLPLDYLESLITAIEKREGLDV